MGLKISPAARHTGAYVEGVDLSKPLDPQTLAKVRHALHDRGVLFFRDQAIDDAQQVALGRQLGRLHIHKLVADMTSQYPEVVALTRKESAAVTWHHDAPWDEIPPFGAILRPIRLPPSGGDTMWCNSCAAYEALSSTMQSFLSTLKASHGGAKLANVTNREALKRGEDKFTNPKDLPVWTHPVVVTIPITGRKALFVDESFTVAIEGMSDAEGAAIINFLCEHMRNPVFHVRMTWEMGTVVIWHNQVTQHYPVPDYEEADGRLMHRVTLQLEEPPQ